MTDDRNLSAADLCEVYATSGVPICFTPDQLRRWAKLLREREALCDDMMSRAKALHERTIRLTVFVVLLTVGNAVMLGGWLL